MRFLKLAPLALAIAFTACSTPQPDKFPYPPQFVQTNEVSVYTLDAPPQPGSAEYKKSVNWIIDAQKKLTPAQIADIKREVHIMPEMLIEPVLGDEFTSEAYPALYTLLKHAGSDAWRINDMLQDHWNETRPYLADQRIKRYVEPITRPGYPSGHTVTNHVWAHVLADLMPCQEGALFKQALATGHNRVLGGAHFPHDVEAGKKLATVIYHRMLEDSQFRIERDAAQAELNEALAYGVPMAEHQAVDAGFIARCTPMARPAAPTLH